MWFEIFSELFVNFSAGLFGLVFVELPIISQKNVWLLLFRLLLAIVTLAIAKRFREESKKL